MTRTQLLILALALLSAVTVGWIVRSGLWRRHRIAFLGVGALALLAVLSRRIGWPELAAVGGVALLAAFMVPARR